MVEVRRAVGYERLVRAAWGTAVVFTVSGALLGTWVSRLPATRDRLHASPAELGLVLLASGVGALTSMPATGWLCRRLGSRRAVLITAFPCCAVLAALAFLPSVPTVAVALFLWGVLYGAWDVSMNVQGSTVEQRAERHWMPRYHGCWSVGGILGSALGSVAARAGVPVPLHFGIAALVCLVLAVLGTRAFVTDRSPDADPQPRTAGTRAWTHMFTARLLAIGAITLCTVVAEGAAADWLAIYLVDARRAAAWMGAAGYATFSAAMAGGRFAGTAITARLGRASAVRAGGLVALAGVVLTVTGPGLVSAYVGSALWALGVCLIFPAAISAAGETPDRSAEAIASVAAIGYGGILVGPPLIGFLANHVGLGRALLVLVVLTATISILAPAVGPARPD